MSIYFLGVYVDCRLLIEVDDLIIIFNNKFINNNFNLK